MVWTSRCLRKRWARSWRITRRRRWMFGGGRGWGGSFGSSEGSCTLGLRWQGRWSTGNGRESLSRWIHFPRPSQSRCPGQAYVLLLALHPSSPVTILLTFHLVPSLLVLRSTIITPHTTAIAIAPTVVELVYWAAVISIPYGDPLDRLLVGAKSKGGGSSGSYGSDLPKHVEEPTCTSLRVISPAFG